MLDLLLNGHLNYELFYNYFFRWKLLESFDNKGIFDNHSLQKLILEMKQKDKTSMSQE